MSTRRLLSVLKFWANVSWAVIAVGLLLLAATVIVVGLLHSRYGLCQVETMYLSRTHWEIARCGLIQGRDPELLVIDMHNASTDITRVDQRVVVLNPADGDVLGDLVTDHRRLIGANTRELWFRIAEEDGPVTACSLPRLDPLYEPADLFARKPSLRPIVESIAVDGMQCDLRFRTKDDRIYRLTPRTGEFTELRPPLPPLAPTILSGWKRCSWKVRGRLYDHRGCAPAQVGEDKLTMARRASGSTADFVISRKHSDGSVRWSVTEEQCFGERADEDVPRWIHYATVHRDRILLVAEEDGNEHQDVYTAAIDVRDGRVLWSRTFW